MYYHRLRFIEEMKKKCKQFQTFSVYIYPAFECDEEKINEELLAYEGRKNSPSFWAALTFHFISVVILVTLFVNSFASCLPLIDFVQVRSAVSFSEVKCLCGLHRSHCAKVTISIYFHIFNFNICVKVTISIYFLRQIIKGKTDGPELFIFVPFTYMQEGSHFKKIVLCVKHAFEERRGQCPPNIR